MEIFAMTDIGNVRTINQDYVRYYQKNDHEVLVVLCDGMGGHNAGEIASQMTCDDIIEQYQNHGEFENENDIRIWFQEMINHAHRLVNEKSYTNENLAGMGTTVVLGLVLNNHLYVSHVGDSRAYLYEDNQLLQLTKDDTFVNVLVDSGAISKDEAFYHPQKNILLQAVGVSEVLKISFYQHEIQDGTVLICSDGLYNSLFDSQIIDILKLEIPLEEKAKALMKNANYYGGKDNIGFALILKKGDEKDA